MTVFEQIKQKLPLYQYVARFVKLKRIGAKCVGLCPFHAEKTPSFQVEMVKNLYYCFGCQSGGDLFDFYANINKTDKSEAVKKLAELAGVKLSNRNSRDDLVVLKNFFVSSLKPEHYEFLYKRGLTEESIKKFEIGFAPSAAEIIQFIRKNSLNVAEYGFEDYFWKMFQNRIVFPIYDRYKILSSFGGRALDSRAKYINGPNSIAFDKSATFFSAITKSKEIFICEGYFDVIMLNQHGYSAVAAMGTSFNETHLALAWERGENLVVAMDGDAAGAKSALKIAYMAISALQIGKTIEFVQFPVGEDPASYLANGMDITKMQRVGLCEYVFANLTHESSAKTLSVGKKRDPNVAAAIAVKLEELSKTIANRNLAFEYRQRWRELWWNFFHSKKKPDAMPFGHFLGQERLMLLLFRYVLLYPEILERVEKLFVQIELPNYMSEQLDKFINNLPLDETFCEKVYGGVVEKINDAEQAFESWQRVYEKLKQLQGVKNV